MQIGSLCAVIAASGFAASANADMVEVVGGQTSVLLDLELIGSVTDPEGEGPSFPRHPVWLDTSSSTSNFPEAAPSSGRGGCCRGR